jgi:DNA-directed RNA polymerase subunit RPC12/RpoP
MDAARNLPERAWEVEYQCPQCGAPAVQAEADRLLACPWCRVRLFVAAEEPYRYLLPPRRGLSRAFFFVPYWRLRGTIFTCSPSALSGRRVDTSVLSRPEREFPLSLGVRPQAMRLSLPSPEQEGVYLTPRIGLAETLLGLEGSFGGRSNPSDRESHGFRSLVPEHTGLVYAPFFLDNGILFDGVSGRSLTAVDEAPWVQEDASSPPGWRPRFLSTLCPDCGNELEGDPRSTVFLCSSCVAAWEPGPEGLRPIALEAAEGSSGRETGFVDLPFWKIRIRLDGGEPAALGDLARLAGLPAGAATGEEDREGWLWSPAFQTPPALFLRLARQMTLVPHPEKAGRILTGRTLFPVTVARGQAALSTRVQLANLSGRKREILGRLASAEIRTAETRLAFVPFRARGSEFIHPRLDFSFQMQRTALDSGTG